MEASGRFAASPPGKDSGAHWIGGWVGARAGLSVLVEIK